MCPLGRILTIAGKTEARNETITRGASMGPLQESGGQGC